MGGILCADRAASVAGLCITPSEFNSKLGEFAEYCPVSLALRGELVDCSNKPLSFAAEYRYDLNYPFVVDLSSHNLCRGKYYRMASDVELDKFLTSPDTFVFPEAPRSLPAQELLPKKKSYADVKALFPKQIELQCFCPVAYVDGKYRYIK